MVRIKIHSDGNPQNTQIFVGDQEISHLVTSIEWNCDAGDDVATVGLTLIDDIDLEVVGDALEDGALSKYFDT